MSARGVQATLILYIVSIFGYSFSRGQYNNRLFWILICGFILLSVIFFSKKARTLFENFSFDSILLPVFIINTLAYVMLFGGLYLEKGYSQTLLEFFLPAVLFSSFIFLIPYSTYRKRIFFLNFMLLIVIAFASRFLMLLASPLPKIDTFDLFRLGPKYLLEGKNPYSQIYTPLYGEVLPNYFSYSPLTLYLFLPADYLFGDPRYTYLVSDLVVVFLLFKILQKSKSVSVYAKYLLPLLFLYHPSSSLILEQSWMDPLIFLMIVLFVYFEKYFNAKKFSFIFLGFFLGMRHTMLILYPLFFLFKKISQKTVILSVAFVLLTFLPFVLWNFHDFWEDIVKFYLSYPIRHDSLTLNSFIFFTFGSDFPKNLLNVLGLSWLVLVIFKKPDTWHKLLLGVALTLFGFSIFNQLAFINHYFLISLLILLACIIGLTEVDSSTSK